MKEIKPQGIPEQVLDNPQSFDLYKWGIWFIGGILAGIVVGAIGLSAFNIPVPDMLGNIGILLAGALVYLINGERNSTNV